ncbi:MAG: hypothetical protein IKJ40_04565, partial [Bacteroidales bacterium]|nr:hypothetical protein [Bacteroidales bacterium]
YLYASKAYKYRTYSVHIAYNGQRRCLKAMVLCQLKNRFLLGAAARRLPERFLAVSHKLFLAVNNKHFLAVGNNNNV